MKVRILMGAMAMAALALSGALAGQALKSGPQVGSTKFPAFNPLHCSGADEGKKICLV